MSETKDDSVESFKAEMRRIDDAGGIGRMFFRDLGHNASMLLAALLWLAGSMGLGWFLPRDAGRALTMPSLLIFSLANLLFAALLWRVRSRDWRFAMGSWLLGGVSMLWLVAALIGRPG